VIPLFVVNASGNTLLSLDDPSVDTDQGAAFTASLLSVCDDATAASGREQATEDRSERGDHDERDGPRYPDHRR